MAMWLGLSRKSTQFKTRSIPGVWGQSSLPVFLRSKKTWGAPPQPPIVNKTSRSALVSARSEGPSLSGYQNRANPGGLGAEPLGQSLWRSQRDCETQRRAPIENKTSRSALVSARSEGPDLDRIQCARSEGPDLSGYQLSAWRERQAPQRA